MALTQLWLTQNVGPPSSSWGSKYSEIHKVTGQFQRAKDNKQFEIGLQLLRLLDKWSWSAHTGATTAAARAHKAKQQLWLNVFQDELKKYLYQQFPDKTLLHKGKLETGVANADTKHKDRVRVILQAMSTSAIAILRNTARHLEENVATMRFNTNGRGGFAGANTLELNPLILDNKNQAMGTLVHECHHKLHGSVAVVRGDLPAGKVYKYLDEFVAHWKEFEITRPSADWQDRGEAVNQKLKSLYADAYTEWEKRYPLLTHIDQAGEHAVPDNENRRSPDSEKTIVVGDVRWHLP